MPKDPWDDPEAQAFLEHSKKDMMPKMKESAMSITIFHPDPDPKLCVELGAAILYDKPLIILVPPGRIVPNNLRRVASAIVEGDIDDPAVQQKMQQAIDHVYKNDRRAKRV